LNYEVHNIEGMAYIIRYPEGFDNRKEYPAIVFLHGAGTRGTSLTPLVENPFFKEVNALSNFPFVVIAPLCHELCWYDLFPQLKRLVSKVTQMPFVCGKRIYLMGASMGGYATWQLAMSVPEYIAAIVPICGGGIYAFADRLINVPAWAFHGGKDMVVYPEESQKMVDAINAAGGDAKLTIYPENDHNAWSDTYSNPCVYQWLLEHQNCRFEPTDNRLDDNVKFG